jgi:VWFA-related protein
MSRGVSVCAAGLLLALAASVVLSARAQKPQFRSGVTLVPVDVRVVDKDGKPIRNLKAEDFQLFEDDVPQAIRQFSELSLDAQPAAAPDAKLAFRDTALDLAPQTNRVFLIVLGRGKLQEPSKGLDSILHFVRSQLLPQDQVALMIYDRATDFTTQHEEIAKIIERFKKAHYDIDFEIRLQVESGLAAIYGSRALPKKTQAKIDMLFEGSPLVASRSLSPKVPESMKADARQQADVLQRQELEKFKAEASAAAGIPNATLWNDVDVIESKQFTDLPFEEFVQDNAQTLQDLGNCLAGVEYLRHVEGEKHLIFVTEKGMFLPRMSDDETLARAANDARVSIHNFQTGGIYVAQTGGQVVSAWNQTFAFQALRNISTWTGGTTSIMDPGQLAVDRINEATRNGYVLAYSPTNSEFNGAYRKISVKVRVPGANVLFRHGYYARYELLPFDRRTFITQDRILAALGFGRPITDIKLKLDCSLKSSESGPGRDLVINLKIDASKLAFRRTADGSRLGLIDIALFTFDQKGQMLASTEQKAELKFTDEVFQKIQKDGIPYNVRFPVNAATRALRMVVYDFKADLIGSVDGSVI